ncbi:MAG: abortive infection family protein [Planctomycetia bacterium]|nr:abortive infection family protein [Planctomycetia bacterium]
MPADPAWDCPKLLRETTNRLTILPRGHSNPGPARESIVTTVRGLLQTIQGLCELRNSYGMASHGRDVAAARLGQRQATLAAQAADTIASFLYRTHRDALAEQPADRVYYEDHPEFNRWLDEQFDVVTIGQEALAPSKVLYHTAINGYKLSLTEFLNTPPENTDVGEST